MLLKFKPYFFYYLVITVLCVVFFLAIVLSVKWTEPPPPGTNGVNGDIVLTTSSASDMSINPRTSEVKGENMYSTEDYRNALIGMVLHKNDRCLTEEGLPDLRSNPIVGEGKSRIKIGDWHCDMAKRTFSFNLPNRQYKGVFESSKEDKLIAIINTMSISR